LLRHQEGNLKTINNADLTIFNQSSPKESFNIKYVNSILLM
jgi:hypothetical protein